MQRFDIRAYKKNIRTRCKQKRLALTQEEKARRDAEILRRLTGQWAVKSADTLLTYVSTPIEVDTLGLIEWALKSGKRVAVPYCVDGTREMRFYLICSAADLRRRTFGVLEPIPERCEELTDFACSVCIVPGLAFDRSGFRLGYGKGYYDRFLSRYDGPMIGLCYHDCLLRSLRRGRYDVSCATVVTELATLCCATCAG